MAAAPRRKLGREVTAVVTVTFRNSSSLLRGFLHGVLGFIIEGIISSSSIPVLYDAAIC